MSWLDTAGLGGRAFPQIRDGSMGATQRMALTAQESHASQRGQEAPQQHFSYH